MSNVLRFRLAAAAGFMVLALAVAPGTGGAITYPHPSPGPTLFGLAAPEGVKVAVELTQRLDTGTNNVGDRFEFKTTKDVKFGDYSVPAGTPGHGRISKLQRANKDHQGSLSLQADSLDLPDGMPVWVNIDTSEPLHGHYADKHSHFAVVAITYDYSGNLILDPGTPFNVVTGPRRARPAPLLTAAPEGGAPPAADTTPMPQPTPLPSTRS
jgi:hypothetical protein